MSGAAIIFFEKHLSYLANVFLQKMDVLLPITKLRGRLSELLHEPNLTSK